MSDDKIEVVAYGTETDVSTSANARVFSSRDEANELVDDLRVRDDVTGIARKTVYLDEIGDEE